MYNRFVDLLNETHQSALTNMTNEQKSEATRLHRVLLVSRESEARNHRFDMQRVESAIVRSYRFISDGSSDL